MGDVNGVFALSDRNVVVCKACSGLTFLIYAVILTVYLALGEGVLPDAFGEQICGVLTQTTTDYRNSGITQLIGAVPTGYQTGVILPVSTFNILWIAVAALYFSALWLCCLPAGFYFVGSEQSGYFRTINLDFNWYRWVHWTITHPLWWVVVLLVAGAHNVFVITLVAFAVVAWIVLLAINEGAGKLPEGKLTEVRGGAIVWVASRFIEAFVCATVLYIVVAAVYFSYAVTAASAVSALTPISATALIYATTISAFILYLFFLCCGVAGHTYFGLWQGSAKEVCYECAYWIFVTVLVWIIAAFAFSYCPAIAPPPVP